MREFVIYVVLLLFAVCAVNFPDAALADVSNDYGDSASQGAQDTVESDVDETLNNSREAYDQISEVTFEETIPKPEDIQDAAGDCLDGILSADFGFGLNVPSVKDLFNQACSTINSEVKGHLQESGGRLQDQYMDIGAALGDKSAPPNKMNYDQRGGEIVDDLWQDIEGDDSSW